MAGVFKAVVQSGRRFPADTRIAIIGAGVSGITAAYTLMNKGYRRIVLFEANDRIGGKVETVQVGKERIELGAVFAMRPNSTLYRMGNEVRGPMQRPMPHSLWLVEKPGETETWFPLENHWGKKSDFDITAGILAFKWLMWRPAFRSIFRPGFYDVHRDLISLTMAEFAEKHRFSAIIEPFQAIIYGSGYGAMTSIAALYHLKLMPHLERARLWRRLSFGVRPGIWMFEGYQKFWESIITQLMAQGLAIRLSSKVTSITRAAKSGSGASIAVSTDRNPEVFDVLIVATPPKQILEYLDATPNERDLLGRVRYFNYHSVAFRARGLDDNAWVALQYNMRPSRNGHLFGLYGWRLGSGLFMGYHSAEEGVSTDELDRTLAKDLAGIGASLEEVIQRRDWTYFPHVGISDLSTGYYEGLNALQGKLDTYFLGALFCFETTEHSAEFAEWLVDHHF
jgi:hypothetical protein